MKLVTKNYETADISVYELLILIVGTILFISVCLSLLILDSQIIFGIGITGLIALFLLYGDGL